MLSVTPDDPTQQQLPGSILDDLDDDISDNNNNNINNNNNNNNSDNPRASARPRLSSFGSQKFAVPSSLLVIDERDERRTRRRKGGW